MTNTGADMTDNHQPLRDAPTDRIKRFVDARTGMQGLDPDIVHDVNTKGEQEFLLLSDLRALLADLDAAVGALEAIGVALDAAEDGCNPPTFAPGYENGHGIEVGSLIQQAREKVRAALSQIKAGRGQA